ncbi:hypothetical protein GCK72_000108 [Caenorhabditis remanei]|uniref:DUF38 domain-containing protein n=2 Tax=Caenorhabditis remanei TaxID=31234 RepID=A0A6A5HNP9_CAERE|nr:hypothetical protein GCK72_000108 [Caenorhabditis remanei]KAF1768296.1 hypothetical protein GCK72_000108 [Caenorhabditis remanei]
MQPTREADPFFVITANNYEDTCTIFWRLETKVDELIIGGSLLHDMQFEKLFRSDKESKLQVKKITLNLFEFTEKNCRVILSVLDITYLKSIHFMVFPSDNISWLFEMEEFKDFPAKYLMSTNFIKGKCEDWEKYEIHFEELEAEPVEKMIMEFSEECIENKAHFMFYGRITRDLMEKLQELETFDYGTTQNGIVYWFTTSDEHKHLRVSLSAGEPNKMLEGMLINI